MTQTPIHALLVAAAILSLGLLSSAGSGGTTKIHYNVDTALTATGVDPNASGRVSAFLKQQGNSDHQRFRLTVAGLTAQASYTLLALIDDDAGTNWVVVTHFNTSLRGGKSLKYFVNRALKKPGRAGPGAGRNKFALPDALDPLPQVRAVSVTKSNGDVVLTANLHEAAGLSYSVASTFVNTGADPEAIGCLAMAIQGGVVQFRLFAAGQSSEYSFWVNEAPVANYPADFGGRISIGVFPHKAPSPLGIRAVSVRNPSNAVVLESQVR